MAAARAEAFGLVERLAGGGAAATGPRRAVARA
jgi:hypothetical protein